MPEQVSDAILLQRFVSRREEAAFMALVARHGRRVEGVCRRILRNEHDVEDISQATFCALASKAAVLPWRDSIAGWLCCVAHRLALGARSDNWRHQQRENTFTSMAPSGKTDRFDGGTGRLAERHHPVVDPSGEIERRDVSRVLYEELSQLPDAIRQPVLLCDLEGRTHEEAALQLGWPPGSMSRRLGRARALLRGRLTRRGISLAIGLVTITLVALGAWNSSGNGANRAVMIRQSMAPLARASGDTLSVLSRTDGHRAIPDRHQLRGLAEEATRVAIEIEPYLPGRNRDLWRVLAGEMRVSAEQLAHAAREDDRTGMILAARRLDASCINCHDLFREPATW